jgi:hypothetical protein
MSSTSASLALDPLYSPDPSAGKFLECNKDISRSVKPRILAREEESRGRTISNFFFLMGDGT